MNERVAIVTGAGRGLGQAIATALAASRVRVMAVALEEEEVAAVAREIDGEYLVESVASEDGCARIIDETRDRLGRIDILVNNAGVSNAQLQRPNRPIWDEDPEVWHTMMAINLDASFRLCRLATPDMVERGWGRIVMVSSTAGEVGVAKAAAYCASKQALLGLMRSVAQDVAPHGVTCNAVLPGYMRTRPTEFSAARQAEKRGISVDEVWRERAALYPAKRVVETAEVASTIAFLSSNAASGINGEAVTVALGGVL